MGPIAFVVIYFLTGLAAMLIGRHKDGLSAAIVGYAFGGFTTLFIAVLFGTKDCFL